ncbi:MAG: efflux RND transporter permease subunit, partial [Planctomyces sp.]
REGWAAAVLRTIPVAHLWGYETNGRPRSEVLADIRDRITLIPGVRVNIGQPISHRLDHIMSGIRAQIAVKIFGSDLRVLREVGHELHEIMSQVPGVVDLQLEPQVEVSQIRLQVRREAAARFGLAPGDISALLETAYRGRVVSQILDDDRFFSLVVWFDEASRNDPEIIQQTILETPSGRRVSLSEVVDVIDTTGPNTLNHEGVERRIVVFCNVEGRDLAGVVAEIRRRTADIESRLAAIPGGCHIEFGGQFQAQQEASLRLLVLGGVSVVAVFLLLQRCLGSWRAALQVLANIPLAALGSIIALLIVNRPPLESFQGVEWWLWPRVWASATSLSIAHWVGFITLIGIVSRNGIMMISHYIHLMENEGHQFGKEMIIQGSLERLAPVMMTAATSFIGLLPLLFGAGQTGKEILHPLALVVFGGMLTSTVLDQLVTPALFLRFGQNVFRKTETSQAPAEH